MRSIAQDVRGRASGKVHFYGKFKGLTLDGAVMTDASMKFDILNTSFALKDTIRYVWLRKALHLIIYISPTWKDIREN